MANKSPYRCPDILFGPFRWHKSFSVFSRTRLFYSTTIKIYCYMATKKKTKKKKTKCEMTEISCFPLNYYLRTKSLNEAFLEMQQHTCTNNLWRCFNPIALRKAKIVYNFGLSECNRVKLCHLAPIQAD